MWEIRSNEDGAFVIEKSEEGKAGQPSRREVRRLQRQIKKDEPAACRRRNGGTQSRKIAVARPSSRQMAETIQQLTSVGCFFNNN